MSSAQLSLGAFENWFCALALRICEFSRLPSLGDHRSIRWLCLLNTSIECGTVALVHLLRSWFSYLGTGAQFLFSLSFTINARDVSFTLSV